MTPLTNSDIIISVKINAIPKFGDRSIDIDMKKSIYLLIPLFMILNLSSDPGRSQDRTKQEVSVTAVEIPVRVLAKGEAVRNLTKDDFEVYENGIRQDITACEIVSRRISLDKTVDAEALKVPRKPRLFILIFNIFDYNQTVGEGIDYFFQNVFRSGDQLIIVTEDRLLNMEKDDDPARITACLKETLKTYKSFATASTIRSFTELNTAGEKVLLYLQGMTREEPSSWEGYLIQFFELYRRVWDEYKRRFFILDVGLYQSLIQRIERTNAEKWAFCFEQRDMFPVLKSEGPLESEIRKLTDTRIEPQDQVKVRQIQNIQREIQRSMNITQGFPGDKLKDLFMRAEITFHLILLKSTRVLFSQDFELRDVAQDYENCFREISSATGGYTTFNNKILEALKEASVKEDYHYLVVYSPKDPSAGKERKIEVKVKKEGVDVISLKQFIAKAQPMITIADFQSGSKRIKFGLKNYARVSTEGKLHGAADVRIIIFDDKSAQVFSEGKTLDLIKDETTISLNFNQLKSGSYFIIIDVFDRLTSGKDVYSGAIRL